MANFGILLYGFAADPDDDCTWGEELWGETTDFAGDSDEFYASLRGIKKPPERMNALNFEVSRKYDAYWKAVKEVLMKCECEIDFHGDGGGILRPYVAIKKSVHRASPGDRIEINGLGYDPQWTHDLLKYCKEMGIPWELPRWYLVSKNF